MTVREGDRDGLSDEGTTSKHLQEVKKQALRHASPRPRGDMPGEMQEPHSEHKESGSQSPMCSEKQPPSLGPEPSGPHSSLHGPTNRTPSGTLTVLSH